MMGIMKVIEQNDVQLQTLGILQTKVLTDEEQEEEIRKEALEKMKQDAEEAEEEGGGGGTNKPEESTKEKKKEARRSVVKRSSKDKSQMEMEVMSLMEEQKRPGTADSKKEIVEKTALEILLER